MNEVKIKDLEAYEAKAHLELCLDLIESVQRCMEQEKYDLAQTMMVDLLETFDRESYTIEETVSDSDLPENIIQLIKH